MIYRNPQEQLQYVTDEVEKIKQSLGSALPDPIPGPEGPAGATGPKGNTGDRGPGIVGYGTELPSTAQDGDMFILRTVVPGGVVDYVMYKWATYQWLPQFSMRGPAGPIGPEGGTEVIANPTSEANDNLNKLKIDGITYNIKDFSSSEVTDLKNIASGSFYFVLNDNKYVFDDTAVEFTYPAFFSNDLVIDDIDDIVGSDYNPLIICENFNDANGNPRFVEGNINVETISGVTFTYHKWSLSGSHLMLVLAGDVAQGTSLGVQILGGVDLPDYINQKIQPLFASVVVAINDARGYYDDWNSINMQTTLMKTSTGVYFYLVQNPTATQDAHFRIQFDLLIDME